MAPRPGDLIGGRYRIVRLIGDGGMGSVYEARHEGLGMSVALKFLHEDLAERPGLTDRFLREARVAATIQSPHVAHVTDVDMGPDGLPYLVMELLVGESLQHLLDRERKLPPPVAIDFALQIAAGLEAAHAVGVVHRDLKPDNVFVTPGAGGALLKLLDFGIAKLLAGQEQRGLTRAGVVMGTAEYMPPEQLYAANEVDGRADVYALGVMLFEMLSGRRPADGEDAQVIVTKVLAGDVLSLGALEPGLPPALVELVRRATASNRDARIGSAHELRTTLASLATGLSPAASLAARAAPIAPRAEAAVKTVPPDDVNTFAKGATEQAPPVGAFGAPPPFVPPAPVGANAPARRSKGNGWLYALLSLVVLGGAAAGGYAFWSAQQTASDLPPPPPADAPPPAEAFTAEGQATTYAPATVPATRPATTPAGAATATHEPHPAASGAQPSTTATAATTSDAGAGVFPLPLQIPSTFPSTFPPLPLPSSFPRTLPNVLPSGFPTSFPGFPGFPSAPAAEPTAKRPSPPTGTR